MVGCEEGWLVKIRKSTTMEEHLSFTMHQFLNAPHRLASVQDETVRTYEKLMQVSCDVVACQQQLDTVATRDEHRASQQ